MRRRQLKDGLRFSRVTIKGQVLDAEPKWHVKVYEDASYRFVYRRYGDAEYAPGFFARDLSRNRWLQLTELSTEHARLGRSPDFGDIPLAVFRGLASAPPRKVSSFLGHSDPKITVKA